MLRARGYEIGEPIVEGAQASAADGLGATSEATRSGGQAGYALLRPGDSRWSGGGFRAEWHGNDHIDGPGVERWHGISYYFPRDYNQGSNPDTWNSRIIFQFADEGSPMFSLHLDAGTQELFLRRKRADGSFQYLGRWPFATERWHDIVIHVVWTKDESGLFELFMDGVVRASFRGPTLAVRDVTYSKWGIYGQPTRLLFDEMRIAEGKDGFAAVSPQ